MLTEIKCQVSEQVITCLSVFVFVLQTVEQAFRQIQNIVDFSSNVMSSLLGEKFIHSGVRHS